MRIVIAEDTAILRDGLVQLLKSRGQEVAAAVGDAPALLAAVEEHRPDVAVVDIRLPPDHTDEGVRAAVELRRRHPDLGILMFSQYVEARFATDLLAHSSKGVGYLLKERVVDIDDFIDALTRVAAGGTALDPEVVTQLVGANRRPDRAERLTPREAEVMALVAEGRTNAAIAGTLVIGERAVEKHVANIFTKFDLPQTDVDHRRVLAVLRYLGVG
ncbi:two component transcriptional regulator, LuxR family [Catenulispora acidiphila DSM 44928]|uniref:Two component transcriptional regulator, LuxR family n=1 Tax=Catenulispora acidiphila (strain DSM 44928 / JCM 14897 / NBRC 102108 / NRRL B-24433 / ID139908) TaxID=479433 RepID=C7PYZ0_CATAD|nr:response regulator transcription factor [Catenulispora acidiphila]ACU69546.1 two component transcriptional regulator, LuxR family [Catenulispora acidiphila DSM 44928]